jgi:transposase
MLPFVLVPRGFHAMDICLRDLLNHSQLRVDDFLLAQDAITVTAATTAPAAECPSCAQLSTRVHGRYVRRILDLSCLGRKVVLLLTVRKFLCCNKACLRAVFCERLPQVVAPYARASARLSTVQRAFGLALGGEAGSRLARRVALTVSPDTLLRRAKNVQPDPSATPRVVGVDDWAWRKGQRYGTILVDLEKRRVLDLLPDREGPTVQRWLEGQPQIEVISRDRSGCYAQAARLGAPQAKQVADRWHLLKNLREALQRLFERRASVVAAACTAPPNLPTAAAMAPAASVNCPPPPSARQAQRDRRVERYHEVRRLHQEKIPIREIARTVGLSRGAVRRYLLADRCPDWQRREAPRTQLDGFRKHIDERIAAGCQDATALHRELTERGSHASYDSVRRFLTRRLAAAGQRRERVNAAPTPPTQGPSARKLSHEIIRKPENRKPEGQANADALRGVVPELGEAVKLVEELAAMIRKQAVGSLPDWLAKAEAAASPELRGFAEGVRQDEAAVSAAIKEEWSNGQVEGQVNRLKVIKRQMYGRAGFQLLRARVLDSG